MSCDINQIVTLGICPDEAESISGFTLMQAAGISPRNIANIATDLDTSGVTMAMKKKELAIRQFRNDFYGALQTNNVVAQLPKTKYETSYFKPEVSKGTYAGDRGVIVHKNSRYKGALRSTKIESVQLYPLASGETTLKIVLGAQTYAYDIEVVANQINVFDGDTLDGFPFEVPYQYENVKVFVDSTEIAFASSFISCKKGCNGQQPNECGWAEGWDGTARSKSEGFGVNVIFYCECEYDKVICDMANSFTGELMWLKWQIAIFEEQVLSNRFDNWVVYNHEEIRDKLLPSLQNAYEQKWNSMMAGLLGILRNYRDDCLDCRGIRRKPNI